MARQAWRKFGSGPQREHLVEGVRVVYWDPLNFGLPPTRRANFGDILGQAVIEHMVNQYDLRAPEGQPRLVSIGSILHFATRNDVVWGTGAHGALHEPVADVALDVRAVRGPRTAEALARAKVSCPPVFGDPGLLTADLPLPVAAARDSGIIVLPHMSECAEVSTLANTYGLQVLSPTAPLADVLRRIRTASQVISSSLHGLVVAESYGVPATWLESRREPEFKYQDYLEGTGRYGLRPVRDLRQAATASPLPPPNVATVRQRLERTFPLDLWAQSQSHAEGALA